MRRAAGPVEVAIFLGPGFPLLSLALTIEFLRVANRECGRSAFARSIVTANGAPVISSSGVETAAAAAPERMAHVKAAVVLTSYEPERACLPGVLGWLRRLDRAGALIACADTGGLLLARAGVLRGRRIAVHHEATPAYREALGGAVLIDRLHARDGPLLSSGGGVATADLVLDLIAAFEGRALANRVAFVMNHDPTPERAPAGDEAALARVDRRIGRMVEIMQARLDRPVPVAEVCRAAGVEPSTARRLFLRFFGETPGRYYARLRLERARRLLGHGALSVGEIAAITGFADLSSFARAYRRQFGRAPSADRHPQPGA